jgi:sporulation protein YlmC with PRC-barrel domain
MNYLIVTLNSFSVKDIYKDRGEDVCKILNLMKECKETEMII